MTRFVRENSLSLFFFAIFVMALLGQSFAGQRAFNAEQQAHAEPTVSWPRYLKELERAREPRTCQPSSV